MSDGITQRAALDTNNSVVRRRKGIDVNILSESCSRDITKLSRFSQLPKLFEAKKKGTIERLRNPFGNPWRTRRRKNQFISIMTSSASGLWRAKHPELPDLLDQDAGQSNSEKKAYRRFHGAVCSQYHYDETVGKILPEMPAFRAMRQDFERMGIPKKFIGHAVLNFDEGTLFRGGESPPEWAYLHLPADSLDPACRVLFKDSSTLDASGHVFDIGKFEVRRLLALQLVACMKHNDVDAVLIDYAVKSYGFALPALKDVLPQSWFQSFQDDQLMMLEEAYNALRANGRELFLNGVMLDGIIATEPAHVKTFVRNSDGIFWEQPFRHEWREYDDGVYDYYQRLDQFFEAIHGAGKRLFVKQGTYRFHATEDIEPSWSARFANTDQGIERHLANYLTCFYLLYADRHRSTLMYTHPVEAGDIFASEAHFDIWDAQLGDPTHARMEIAAHVHMRGFGNGVVFLNNRLESASISDKLRPKGFPRALPTLALEPLSGLYWPFWDRTLLTTIKRFTPIETIRALGGTKV